MAQYIDKSALVAKIENRIKELQNLNKENEEKLDSIQKTAILLCIDECKVILSFLDALEVKEVNLVEEIDYKDYIRFFKEHPEYSDGSWGFEETWTFAQYCYKLGLNAWKGE